MQVRVNTLKLAPKLRYKNVFYEPVKSGQKTGALFNILYILYLFLINHYVTSNLFSPKSDLIEIYSMPFKKIHIIRFYINVIF